MSVRAKFYLQSRIRPGWVNHDGSVVQQADELRFGAVFDDGIPENQRFSKATPVGTLTMMVDNEKALSQFVVGHYYYLDFTDASESAD